MLTKRFFKTKEEVEVTFEIDLRHAESVEVAGTWNEWEPIPMKRADRGRGPFRTKVRLPKDGDFEFRYRVDGDRWENDEAADGYRPNEYGSDNSVVTTSD